MNWDWVLRDQLATGSMPVRVADADTLDGIGITHVLNVADDRQGDNEGLLFAGRGMAYRRVPFADTGAIPPPEWFDEAVRWGHEALAVGGTLYVHCLVGSARGPSMTYAILRRLGWDHDAAEAAVRRARPAGSLWYIRDAKAWTERAG